MPLALLTKTYLNRVRAKGAHPTAMKDMTAPAAGTRQFKHPLPTFWVEG